jgi:hypothetical protein
MKNNIISKLLLMLTISLAIMSCKKNDALNFLTEKNLMDYDLIQLSNASPYIPVTFEYGDGGVPDSVGAFVYRQGTTTVVSKNMVKQLTQNSISGATISIPFPLPSVAPSGLYTIELILYGKNGGQSKKSFTVNIVNAQTPQPPSCAFPELPLPSGRNAWIRITAPENTGNDDVFITGNFETAMGGNDWSGGGNTTFRMTRIPNSRCYYIAVNLQPGAEFKFTRGDWNKRVQDGNGADVPNFVWNGQTTQTFLVENWSDRVVIAPRPDVIPQSAIQTGRLTVVVDVDPGLAGGNWYIMRRGGNFATDKIEMTVFGSNPNKYAASIPRQLNERYLIYKTDANNNVINAYGIDQAAIWDGVTNPVTVYANRLKPSGAIRPISTTLALVGGATPQGWNNTVNNPQVFSIVPNTQNYRFTYTVALSSGNGGYLLIPTPGDWSQKWGARGSFRMGNVVWDGADFAGAPTTADAGNYKIDVDFERGTYMLTKQ